MTLKWYLALSCLLGTLHGEEYAYFTPPPKWKVVEHADLPVKITFLGKPKKNCVPLINLATEEVSISLKEYVAIVKKNCKADPSREWSDLGAFSTLAGEGRLIEILRRTEGGDLRQLQLLFIKGETAYVVTTSCAKEEFAELGQVFYAALKSFNVTSDLLKTGKESERLKQLCSQLLKDFSKEVNAREAQKNRSQLFSDKKFQKEKWLPFEKNILNNYAEMGNHWKILLLKDIKNKLISQEDLSYAQD